MVWYNAVICKRPPQQIINGWQFTHPPQPSNCYETFRARPLCNVHYNSVQCQNTMKCINSSYHQEQQCVKVMIFHESGSSKLLSYLLALFDERKICTKVNLIFHKKCHCKNCTKTKSIFLPGTLRAGPSHRTKWKKMENLYPFLRMKVQFEKPDERKQKMFVGLRCTLPGDLIFRHSSDGKSATFWEHCQCAFLDGYGSKGENCLGFMDSTEVGCTLN